MKYMVQVFLLVFSFSASASQLDNQEINKQATLSDLSSLNWQNRLIVVNNIQNEKQALTIFEKHVDQIDDRHIVWFIIKDNKVLSNYSGKLSESLLTNIQNKYQIGQAKVVLIGKDGGVKSQFDFVDLESIFLQIDAMPMRQMEMRH